MLTVELRVDVGGSDWIPHSFIVVTGPDGIAHGYGLAPREHGHLTGDGKIYDDTNHEYSSTTGVIDLSPAGYLRLMNFINESQENPPPYYLPFGSQCANWAVKALIESGVPAVASPNLLPDYFIRDLFETITWNPYTQWLNIAISNFITGLRNVSFEDILSHIVDLDNINGITQIDYNILGDVNTHYLTARNHLPRKDPLVLDLDGGGISTTPIDPNAPRLFDTDGDGVRTATGWVGAGEGIVVRDLNGNGTIDSGRELFGDATVLTQGPNAGQTAAHGFAALADLDSNADGQFDAADAAFASVRLWLDANQDAISQPAELHTLAEKGVARIEVAASVHNVDLGGGNVQTYSASFTRTSGQQGSAGTAPLAGSLLLAGNSFYRQFSDDPATTPEAAALPAMHGSGWVRDLHPALSLGNGEAAALQAGLAAFAAAPTRAQQLALLDGVLAQWAASSGKLDSQRGAYSLVQEGGHYLSAGRDLGPNPIADLYVQTPGLSEAQRAALFQKLAVLEVFNGSRFFDITWDGSRFGGAGTGGGMGMGMAAPTSSGGGSVADPVLHFIATMSPAQIAPIEQAWDALRESVYGALVVQTRLKPYLDAIALVIDDSGIRFDASASIARVQERAAADPFNAVGWHTYSSRCAIAFKNKSVKAPYGGDSEAICLKNASHRASGAGGCGKVRRLRGLLSRGARRWFQANTALSPRPRVIVCY